MNALGPTNAAAQPKRAAVGDPYSTAELSKVALGWLVVLVPAAWGVAQVVIRSAALFRG